jgi:hypothetical protein
LFRILLKTKTKNGSGAPSTRAEVPNVAPLEQLALVEEKFVWI